MTRPPEKSVPVSEREQPQFMTAAFQQLAAHLSINPLTEIDAWAINCALDSVEARARHEGRLEERERANPILDAAWALLLSLEAADANEDLGFDDMEKVNALRWAFPKCEKCNGHGTHDGLPHEDEFVERCAVCEGHGILRALALPEGDAHE